MCSAKTFLIIFLALAPLSQAAINISIGPALKACEAASTSLPEDPPTGQTSALKASDPAPDQSIGASLTENPTSAVEAPLKTAEADAPRVEYSMASLDLLETRSLGDNVGIVYFQPNSVLVGPPVALRLK